MSETTAPDVDWHDLDDPQADHAQEAAVVHSNGTARTPRPRQEPAEDPTLGTVLAELDAERATLGGCLLDPDQIPNVAQIVRDDDWSRPAHTAIWHALVDLHATGRPTEPTAVWAHLQAEGNTRVLGEQAAIYLLQLTETAVAASATYYADVVARTAVRRRTDELGVWLTQHARNPGNDDAKVAQRLTLALQERDRLDAATSREDIQTLDDLLAEDLDDEPAWIIPGLLERGDRMILTAGEGKGKSTLLRQIAIMCAAGLHPFTGHVMDPITVLCVDLENSKRQTRRKTRALRIQAGPRLEAERLRFQVRVQGLDLTRPDDIGWLRSAVARYRPDLLITGPIYKLGSGNPNDEETAKPVALAIDSIRAEHDVAVILEAHSAKGIAGAKHRPREPFGWSGWMRWPEFGLHLGDDGTLSHWRGQRDERDWPELLLRGGHWPWMPAVTTPDQRWAQIHQALTAAGERLSNRELATRTGIPETTIRRLLEQNSRRLAALLEHLGATNEEP